MSNGQQSFYWFDSVNGNVFLSEEQLPGKKSHLYLVVNREKLFFSSFSLQGKKRVKDNDILNIQGHFIPFKNDFMNIIYSTEKAEDKRFYSWVGPLTLNVESYFYDEIPETLVFRGNPAALKKYHIFVFKRISGFEVIYLNGFQLYSLFTREEAKIVDSVVLLARKFSLGEKISIFTDTDIPGLPRLPSHYRVSVDLAGNGDRYFFMPDHFQVKKKFSNISRSKQLKSIKHIIRQWGRNLTVIAALLLLVILVNGAGFIMLKNDNRQFKQKFAAIDKIDRRAEMIRFRLNKIKEKIALYPDHMLYLKTVSQCMDFDSTLIAYSMEKGRIIIEGYSKDSLGLLDRLRKSNRFKEVRFKTTVTKDVYSRREKFEIEMVLKR